MSVEELGFKEGKDFSVNNRKVIKNPYSGCFLELDIWFPAKRIAFEIDGLYNHTADAVKFRDKVKNTVCQDLQIKLTRITDEQILKNWEEVCQIIYCLLIV